MQDQMSSDIEIEDEDDLNPLVEEGNPDCESCEIRAQPIIHSTSHYYAFMDQKAGMSADKHCKDRVAQIVHESSVGSKYFAHEECKDVRTQRRIRAIRDKLSSLTGSQAQAFETQADIMLAEAEKLRSYVSVKCVCDLDAFYAMCEERQNPALKSLPVAIGGEGMICTANYEARKYGVRSAMPGFIGRRLCPSLVFVRPSFALYTEVAEQVRAIFSDYDPDFRAGSLDEAFLDLTSEVRKRLTRAGARMPEDRQAAGLASWVSPGGVEAQQPEVDDTGPNAEEAGKAIAQYWAVAGCVVHEMRARIRERVRITASAGIASTFTLAKIASNVNKPDGQRVVIDPFPFMRDLPIRKVPGIGRITERLITEGLGVNTCRDLYFQRASLFQAFTTHTATFLLTRCVALDSATKEEDRQGERRRKGMSKERTFEPVSSQAQIRAKLQHICDGLACDLREANLKPKTVTLKLKTSNFDVHVRAKTLQRFVASAEELFEIADGLLTAEKPSTLRLIGVRCSNFQPEPRKGKESIDTFVRKNIIAAENHLGPDGTLSSDAPYIASAPSFARSQDQRHQTRESSLATVNGVPGLLPVSVRTADPVGNYSCPNCKTLQANVSLSTLNHHLDNCLVVQGHPRKRCSEIKIDQLLQRQEDRRRRRVEPLLVDLSRE